MGDFFKNIGDNNKILIVSDEHGINSYYYTQYFFEFILTYLKEHKTITINREEYKNSDKLIKKYNYDDKLVIFYKNRYYSNRSAYISDLIIKVMNNGDINIIKSRFTNDGVIGNMKNLKVFQRRIKLNKIINETRSKRLHIC